MTAAPRRRYSRFAAALPPAVVAAMVALPAAPADAASTTIVINEVYGGGGNTGAPFSNDFIELRNIGTTTVDISGWSLQYAGAPNVFNAPNVQALSGEIPPGGYFLVQEAVGAASPAALPSPDATGSFAMGATAGKVALVDNLVSLAGCSIDCDGASSVVDFVGYGATANDSETSPTLATSNTTSVTRNAAGADTDNNSADFSWAQPPTPQSCASTGTCATPAPNDSTIAEIQGAAHLSPMSGDDVTGVRGIITARRSNGFYMQDPLGEDAEGWVEGASSGIFVFTNSAPAAGLVPGTSVTVDGRVSEFRPGSTGLTVTEIVQPTVTAGPATDLPASTLVGPGGLTPPAEVVDDDADGGPAINVETAGAFQPAEDGIDFWESLEGMRLELDNGRVVGPYSTFGELPIVPAGSGIETARGGIVLRATDANPERVILDNGAGTALPTTADVGDTLAGATVGVLDYEFNNYHLMATAPSTLESGNLEREVTDPSARDQLSVGTFNVENLDPNDPQRKFRNLARIVVDNMQAPDLLALEEVQDNTGATDDGVVAADETLREFVDAIEAVGGPTYTWQQIDPVNDLEGGEPGGNIRVAFLIQEGTPLQFVERAPGNSTTDTDVTMIDGQAALTHSPGRVDPGNAAWTASRVPLAGEFTFGGQKVFAVANHWSSKGGDQPLMGPNQPPAQSSAVRRQQQAQVVRGFVDEIFAQDASANVIVLGDLNDFEYSQSLLTLRNGGSQPLLDLPTTLPVQERYTYVFEGNSQVLDHILVSGGLANQGFDYDVVHVNAEFHDQASDHDPQVVTLDLGLHVAGVTAETSADRVVYGQPATISGQLVDVSDETPLAGREVSLEARTSGSDPWLPTGDTATTDAGGGYTFTVRPERNTSYRVVFAGDATYNPAHTQGMSIEVAPRVTLTVSDTTVKKGTTVLFTGLVVPNHAGQAVYLQRKTATGAWVNVRTLTLNGDSQYTFRWTAKPKGVSVWRVQKPADADHVTGTSARVRIRVS